jgi:hypothetical protein
MHLVTKPGNQTSPKKIQSPACVRSSCVKMLHFLKAGHTKLVLPAIIRHSSSSRNSSGYRVYNTDDGMIIHGSCIRRHAAERHCSRDRMCRICTRRCGGNDASGVSNGTDRPIALPSANCSSAGPYTSGRPSGRAGGVYWNRRWADRRSLVAGSLSAVISSQQGRREVSVFGELSGRVASEVTGSGWLLHEQLDNQSAENERSVRTCLMTDENDYSPLTDDKHVCSHL